jgi:hypothetical protein
MMCMLFRSCRFVEWKSDLLAADQPRALLSAYGTVECTTNYFPGLSRRIKSGMQRRNII